MAFWLASRPCRHWYCISLGVSSLLYFLLQATALISWLVTCCTIFMIRHMFVPLEFKQRHSCQPRLKNCISHPSPCVCDEDVCFSHESITPSTPSCCSLPTASTLKDKYTYYGRAWAPSSGDKNVAFLFCRTSIRTFNFEGLIVEVLTPLWRGCSCTQLTVVVLWALTVRA